MKNTLLSLALLGLTAAFAHGQGVSIGVKGGIPLTDGLDATKGNSGAYVSNTHRYLVGGTVEFHLPARFSIEIDGLYKRVGYDFAPNTFPGYTTTRFNSWEFPALLKFEITPGPVRPFVDAGVNIRNISGLRQVRQVVNSGTLGTVTVSNPAEFNKDTDFGATAGVGIAFKAGWVRISPEIRYTYWGTQNFNDAVNAALHSNRNQADFMVGFTF